MISSPHPTPCSVMCSWWGLGKLFIFHSPSPVIYVGITCLLWNKHFDISRWILEVDCKILAFCYVASFASAQYQIASSFCLILFLAPYGQWLQSHDMLTFSCFYNRKTASWFPQKQQSIRILLCIMWLYIVVSTVQTRIHGGGGDKIRSQFKGRGILCFPTLQSSC